MHLCTKKDKRGLGGLFGRTLLWRAPWEKGDLTSAWGRKPPKKPQGQQQSLVLLPEYLAEVYFVEVAETYSPVRAEPWKRGFLQQGLLTVLITQKQRERNLLREGIYSAESGALIEGQLCPL